MSTNTNQTLPEEILVECEKNASALAIKVPEPDENLWIDQLEHFYMAGATEMYWNMDKKLADNAWGWIQKCNEMQDQITQLKAIIEEKEKQAMEVADKRKYSVLDFMDEFGAKAVEMQGYPNDQIAGAFLSLAVRIFDKLIEEKEKDVYGFAIWTQEQRWEWNWRDKIWENDDIARGIVIKTTSELYELYKQSIK